MSGMSPNEVRRIVRETVRETLSGMGFDISTPMENQADLAYLRRLRKGSEDMARRVRASTITIAVTTALYLLWEAVKALIVK